MLCFDIWNQEVKTNFRNVTEEEKVNEKKNWKKMDAVNYSDCFARLEL